MAFLTLLKTAEQWSISVLEFLAHMNMEDIQTQEGIQRLKTSLNEFTHVHPEIEESKVCKKNWKKDSFKKKCVHINCSGSKNWFV